MCERFHYLEVKAMGVFILQRLLGAKDVKFKGAFKVVQVSE